MTSTPVSVLRRKPLHSSEDLLQSVYIKESTDHVDKPQDSNELSESPFQLLAVIFHFSMTLFYALLLYYGNKLMSENAKLLDPQGIIPKYGGRFKFLTHVNQWFQLLFFGLQFITDLLPRSSVKHKLQNVSDRIFTTIAMPISLFVAITFWAIYAVDRKLVYPDRFDLFVPPYMNHFWHTTIALWVTLEVVVYFHRFPKLADALLTNLVVNLAYLGWILWVYNQTGFWVYPILKVLPFPYLLLFFAGSISFSMVLYFVGKGISYTRWSKALYL